VLKFECSSDVTDVPSFQEITGRWRH